MSDDRDYRTAFFVKMPWPDDLKRLCKDDCAERGERACWEVDAECEPHHAGYAMRGRVCPECWAGYAHSLPTKEPKA